MSENTRKSFYIFLAMVLGVLLFLMVQRAIFIAAYLFGADIASLSAQAISVLTTAIAVAFGAWYGVWLGLIWYAAVYEERSTESISGYVYRRFLSPSGSETDEFVAVRQGGGSLEADLVKATRLQSGAARVVRRSSIQPKSIRPKRALAKKG